jgi:superfamily II DNA or RNA helicase
MLGRGLRLHPGKESCVILDYTDNVGRHSLASAWRWLGYDSPPEDEEPREIPDERKPRQSKVVAIDLEREVDLLLPPELPTFSGQWTYEPATEKQLGYLAALGYDVETVDYSKGNAAALISNHPASVWQLKKLEKLGFDVSVPWTNGQFSKAVEKRRESMLSSLAKIRRAGFEVETKGRNVLVSPKDRLTPVQAQWVERNKYALALALRG